MRFEERRRLFKLLKLPGPDTDSSSFPQLNESAPGFKALTTHGVRSLSDHEGNWLILCSLPADFTTLCTTELVGIAKAAGTFEKMNCELLGLSIDSVTSRRCCA